MRLIAVKRNTTQVHEVLKVDIDLPWDLFIEIKEHWEKTRYLVFRRFNLILKEIIYQPSQNGKTHVFVHVETSKPLTPYEKALIQFLLGDDHNRARLNFERARRTPSKFDSFNILFSKKVVKRNGEGEDMHKPQ